MSNTTVYATALLLLLALGQLLRKAYRQPLPGIPYNHEAARRLMGDLPEIGEWQARGKMRPWFLSQAHRHNSPITQIFLGPFAKPAVLVSDYREANDILSHRDAVDFKRGKKVDVFAGILPHAFPALETYDPRFKACRDLTRDLMAPSLLGAVNAPRIHAVACHLVSLWRLKAQMAQGRCFDTFQDIIEFSFDAILAAAIGLGPEGGDVERQLTHLLSLQQQQQQQQQTSSSPSPLQTPLSETAPVIQIPSLPPSSKLSALGIAEESLWKGFYMPWPRLYHALNKTRPSVRRAWRTLQSYISARITIAAADVDREPESALDHMLQRELRAAARDGRAPILNDPRVRDNTYGYMIAGHDTSAGSILWSIRHLLTYPEWQRKIRADLHGLYPAARREGRVPTAAELVTGDRSAILDAFLEEVLRLTCPVVTIMVTTRCDTAILGHRVPADTQVFLNLTGPSLNMPSVGVDEGARSETSRRHKPPSKRDNWDDDEPTEFRPERWLAAAVDSNPTRGGKGEEEGRRQVFDAAAGPTLAFSAGNRGCWGKRLGYMELRILLAVVIWELELKDAPEEVVNWETYDSLVTAPKECILSVESVRY